MTVTMKRLDAIRKAFRAGNSQDLKRLGRDAINQAVLENNKRMAKISVVSYALYKMLSKDHFTKNPRWPVVVDTIYTLVGEGIKALEANNEKKFSLMLDKTISEIENIDDELSHFAKNIYEKAKVKQASTAYALGMSLSNSASLTGARLKDLQIYIGHTRIHDEQETVKGIRVRLNEVRELLSE